MNTRREFNRQVRLLAFFDVLFTYVTPIFCVLALAAVFAVTIWGK